MKWIKHLKNLKNMKINNLDRYLGNYRHAAMIVLLLVALTIVLETLFYYRGIYFSPQKYMHNLSISSIGPEAKKFTDIFEKTEGVVLIDRSHENNFESREMETLLSRIASRNNKIEFLDSSDNLENKLRRANSLVVILPKNNFAQDEIGLIGDFSNKNGKLLLIGDPERQGSINSIANKLGIIFSEDYLFNLKENDDNFKFIFLKDFAKSEITKRLDKVAFYTSCPILPAEKGIIFADKDTSASRLNSLNRFAPAVFLNSTLALCDFTFLNAPFNSVADNDRLISNIADFLTRDDRKFNIADFPYFFKDRVAIVAVNSELSGSAVSLRNILLKLNTNANIKGSLNTSIDSIVIGLLDDFKSAPIENLAVDKDSFRINEMVFGRKDSSLIHLSKANATILTILSDSKKAMEKTLATLKSREIRENLIDDNLAVLNFESEGEASE